METESKKDAMEDVGQIPPTAGAASPGREEMKEIPAATLQTGQLQHQQRKP